MLSIKPTNALRERWAILDCNSFYCSCERLFRPDLRNKPVVVLSNNDGCMISVSAEAKQLGLQVGHPMHQSRELIRRHDIAVFSSNYQLYGELSRRVMRLLDELHPDVLQYSIDEAFIDFSHLPEGVEEEWATQLCARVQREIGIPVSIGVGTTKTIAKIASKWTKKKKVPALALLDEKELEHVLKNTALSDVWGVGFGSTAKLKGFGMGTAWDLREHDNTPLIRAILTVTGERTRDELRGISCIDPGEMSEKKMIASTRSFGKRVYDRRELEEAVATYVGFACEKLRAQGSVARGLIVSMRSNPFDEKEKLVHTSLQTVLDSYTSDTGAFTRAAIDLVRHMYRPGVPYKKAGVFLIDLTPRAGMQMDIFSEASDDQAGLMAAMDEINRRWGRGTVRMAATGTKQDWRMLCEQRSEKTQLKWSDLLEVRAEKLTTPRR